MPSWPPPISLPPSPLHLPSLSKVLKTAKFSSLSRKPQSAGVVLAAPQAQGIVRTRTHMGKALHYFLSQVGMRESKRERKRDKKRREERKREREREEEEERLRQSC